MKKGATGQSFIRKEITCYRIGTLVSKVGSKFSLCFPAVFHPGQTFCSQVYVNTLNYPIKEHARSLIFQHFAPSARFFPPCSCINFQKKFHPACYLHPARLFLFCKEIFTPCSFSFSLLIFYLHLIANANKYNRKL